MTCISFVLSLNTENWICFFQIELRGLCFLQKINFESSNQKFRTGKSKKKPTWKKFFVSSIKFLLQWKRTEVVFKVAFEVYFQKVIIIKISYSVNKFHYNFTLATCVPKMVKSKKWYQFFVILFDSFWGRGISWSSQNRP